MTPYHYIVVEGCIGVGKTTLAKRLAIDYNAELILERFDENIFLAKFYKDPVHYAFPVEMTFLTDRYEQLKNLLSSRDLFTDLVIGDYFIDKSILFAKNNLPADEYKLFRNVFNIIATFLPKPDLILYLYKDIPHLLRNIVQRGRDYERDISATYLENIQDNYMTYFREHPALPVVIVETTSLDFVRCEEDYLKIKKLVEKNYSVGIHRVTF